MKKQMQTKQKKADATIKRRRLSPTARRVELLEAAMAVLKRLGPANARVEDITAAAGAAKGTFYLYFSSWEDMLAAVREHILTTYVAETRKRFQCESFLDWWPAFVNECATFITFYENLGELHKAIFHGTIAERPIPPALSSEAIIGWMLEKGIKTGACRNVDVDVAARLVFSVMHTTADNIARTEERERHLDPMLEMLHSWLYVPAMNIEQQKTYSTTEEVKNDRTKKLDLGTGD